MKATLTVQNDAVLFKKIYVAARIKSVKLGSRTTIADKSLLEVDFKNPTDLYEMGLLVSTVSGNEFDEQLAKEKAAADARAAKIAAESKGKK